MRLSSFHLLKRCPAYSYNVSNYFDFNGQNDYKGIINIEARSSIGVSKSGVRRSPGALAFFSFIKRLLQNRIFGGGQIVTDSGLPSESRHDGG